MNKQSLKLNALKLLCVERLWFVLLLTPLLVIAIMIAQHFLPNKKQHSNRGVAMVMGAVEISAVELATIIAKPLTELVAMEVYAVAQNSSVATASSQKNNFQQVTYSQLSEIRPVSANPISVVSYVVEHPKTKRIREAS